MTEPGRHPSFFSAFLGLELSGVQLSDDASWVAALAIELLDDWAPPSIAPPIAAHCALIAAIHQAGYLGEWLVDDGDGTPLDLDIPLGTYAGRWARSACLELLARGVELPSPGVVNNVLDGLTVGGTSPVGVPVLAIAALWPFAERTTPRGSVLLPPSGLHDPDQLLDRAVDALVPADPPGADGGVTEGAHRDHRRRPVTAPTTRPVTLSPEVASRTVAAFEGPFAALTAVTLDDSLPDWDADFVRNTLQQISLWRQRDDANPQILELLIADVVERLHDQLSNTDAIEAAMRALGADESVAMDVAQRTSAALSRVAGLGMRDPVEDSSRIDQIAAEAEHLVEAAAAGLADVDSGGGGAGADRAQRYRTAIVEGAASGATAAAITALATFSGSHWSQIQLGLVAAWTVVRSLWR